MGERPVILTMTRDELIDLIRQHSEMSGALRTTIINAQIDRKLFVLGIDLNNLENVESFRAERKKIRDLIVLDSVGSAERAKSNMTIRNAVLVAAVTAILTVVMPLLFGKLTGKGP